VTAAHAPTIASPAIAHLPIRRVHLDDARTDRLFFAQVREDPRVELRALRLKPTDRVVIVSSGGCTALSMLAEKPREVVCVDVNTVQNHLVELKALAVATMEHDEALRFLGAWPPEARTRLSAYVAIRESLSPAARRHWDGNRRALVRGVLDSGVSERFLRILVGALRPAVHSPATIEALFACDTLAEQRSFYAQRWNTRRWRLMLRLLVNRVTFRKTFHSAFMEHVEERKLSAHFGHLIEQVITEVPIGENYFLRQMLTGSYAQGPAAALPPYLQPGGGRAVAGNLERLVLVDGSYTAWLRGRPDASVDAFALSNIVEWIGADELEGLLEQVLRTAAPGARLVFRNFLGWTEVPAHLRHRIVEDPELSADLIADDRSGMQKRAAVCTIVAA
jgi:S-adenosylmethionine:diacylglycerol 3-amino-3-carboxypropyl transferase